MLSVNQIGIKEGQTTFLKSADSHQSGRLHPGLMFKQIEMSLFLTDHALQHNHQGEGSRPIGRTPLHLQTKSPVFTKILARRYISSPFHFNRPVTTDFWKQRKLVRPEIGRSVMSGHCPRLSSRNNERDRATDRPHLCGFMRALESNPPGW